MKDMWQDDFVNTLQGRSDYTHMCVIYWSAGSRTQSAGSLLQEKRRETLGRQEIQCSYLGMTLPFDKVAGRLSIDFFINCELLSAPALGGDI